MKTFELVSVVVTQIVSTALIICIGTYLADDVRTPLHAVWIFGMPIGIALIGNSSVKMRGIMALVLIICSIVSGSLTGEFLGQGP